MKSRTCYDLRSEDIKAVIGWLKREKSYREIGEIFGVSHQNARNHLAGVLRQLYEEGIIEIKIKN